LGFTVQSAGEHVPPVSEMMLAFTARMYAICGAPHRGRRSVAVVQWLSGGCRNVYSRQTAVLIFSRRVCLRIFGNDGKVRCRGSAWAPGGRGG
jgi:hypothetical protein